LPRISLVTPTLNQARYLRSTMESVLSQGYPDLEYMVQDGGSTDGTLEVLRQYADRVPFVSEGDRGQADAINRGLRRSTGDILGYLNSDDVFLPGTLRAVGEAFTSDPTLVLVFGRAIYVDDQGHGLAPYLTRHDAFERLADACFIAQPATFWRRTVWNEVGEFDETLHHTMDYDYWLRVAARYGAGPVRYLDRELAAARLHADAKSVAAWGRGLEEILALVKRRTGYVSLWWLAAKWDHRLGGRHQATHPHPVPWRAYPPAIFEFLYRNPPRLWQRGLKRALPGLVKRLRA
jgi:glycosyltransferase involved in cell wall biosynthesis